MLLTGSPNSGVWSQGDRRFSQVPRQPDCAYALFSDPGRALTPSLHGVLVLPPKQGNAEGLSYIMTFGAQSQSLSTRCLRFVPPLLATTQNSLPGVANLSRVGFQCTH